VSLSSVTVKLSSDDSPEEFFPRHRVMSRPFSVSEGIDCFAISPLMLLTNNRTLSSSFASCSSSRCGTRPSLSLNGENFEAGQSVIIHSVGT
jgi:hypothetical protein